MRALGKRRSAFVKDPTTGALIVNPDFDLKIRKSLAREVSRLKFGLYVRFAGLYLSRLALQARLAMTRLRICRSE